MSFIEDFHSMLSDEFPGIAFSIGEIVRETEGVYLVTMQSPRPPEQNTGVFYESIVLWSIYKDAQAGLNQLEAIYDFLHQYHHYDMGDHYVWWTQADSRPEDGDRTPEGMKIWRLPIMVVAGKRS